MTEVETTRGRLDQFRESYRKAQTYLNTSTTQIESLTTQLESTQLALTETRNDAEATESQLNASLLEATSKIRILEPQAKNCAIVMKQKEDADLYISEIEMELNQQADLKSMLEKKVFSYYESI